MSATNPRRANDRSWMVVISGLICLLGVAAAVFELRAARHGNAALTVSREENRRLELRLGEIRSLGLAELKRAAEVSDAVKQLERSGSSVPAPDPLEAGRLFLAAHPESRELVRAYRQALAGGWPTRDGRAAGFSEEQIKAWTELFARQRGAPAEVDGIRVPGYGELDAGEVQGPRLQALVGDALYAKFKAYDGTSSARMYTTEIAAAADGMGVALTPEQSRALMGLFSESHGEIDWEAAARRASGILSESQMSAFHTYRAIRVNMDAESSYRDSFFAAREGMKP